MSRVGKKIMKIKTRFVIFQHWRLNSWQLQYRASFKVKSECLLHLRCVPPIENSEIDNLLGCPVGVLAV